MKNLYGLLESIVPPFFIFLASYLLHRRELKKIELTSSKELYKIKVELTESEKRNKAYLENKIVANKKSEYLPRIMTLKNAAFLEKSVEEVFNKTRATSFMVFIGVNGKYDLKNISCIWYQYKNSEDDDVNPILAYRNVDISKDDFYKSVLSRISKKDSEYEKIDTMKMPKSILKDIYGQEQISFSRVGFLSRRPIDSENDFMMFFQFATDSDNGDFSHIEESIIKLNIDSKIKPNIIQLQNV